MLILANMKIQTLPRLLLLLLFPLLIASCEKPAGDLDNIPGESQSLLQVRLPQLVEKSNINYIRDSVGYDLIKMGMAFMGIPDFIEDRSRLGIDFHRNLYLFRPDTLPDAPLMAFFYVSSPDSLIRLLRMTDNSLFVKKEEGITKIQFAFGQILIRGEKAYYCVEKDEIYSGKMRSYFDMKADESLGRAQPDIAAYFARADDISFWAGEEKIEPEEWGIEAGKTELLPIGKKILGALNFGNGYVRGNYTESGGPRLRDFYKSALDAEFEPALMSGLDFSQGASFISLHLRPEAHKQVIRSMGNYEKVLKSCGYDEYYQSLFKNLMERMEPSFDGRSVWAVNGRLAATAGGKKSFFGPEEESIPRWHIAISLNNGNEVEHLLKTDAYLEESGHLYLFRGSRQPLYLATKGKTLFMSNDPSYLHERLNAPRESPAIPKELLRKMRKYPVYARADEKGRVLLGASSGGLDMEGMIRLMTGNALKAVQFLELRAGQNDEFPFSADLEVQLKEKDRNALEELITALFENLSMSSFKDIF